MALWHVTYPERLEGVCYTHKSFHGVNKLEQRRLSRKESRVFVCCRKVDSGRCERVVIYRLADQTPDTATRLRAQRSHSPAARHACHCPLTAFLHVVQTQLLGIVPQSTYLHSTQVFAQLHTILLINCDPR